MNPIIDQRPIVVAIAGPNGAGKSTFHQAHLRASGLRFVNADVIAHDLGLGPYEAARVADVLRRSLLGQGESFIFETVFSDSSGDKLSFLQHAAEQGYTVVVCFIGISSVDVSDERVAMRVSQGGHDVPIDKLQSRYPRSLANLGAAIQQVDHVLVFDNDDLAHPYRRVAWFEKGTLSESASPLPGWLAEILRD